MKVVSHFGESYCTQFLDNPLNNGGPQYPNLHIYPSK